MEDVLVPSNKTRDIESTLDMYINPPVLGLLKKQGKIKFFQYMWIHWKYVTPW